MSTPQRVPRRPVAPRVPSRLRIRALSKASKMYVAAKGPLKC